MIKYRLRNSINTQILQIIRIIRFIRMISEKKKEITLCSQQFDVRLTMSVVTKGKLFCRHMTPPTAIIIMYALLSLLLLSVRSVVVFSFDLDHHGPPAKKMTTINDDVGKGELVENLILDHVFVQNGLHQRKRRRKLEPFVATKSCGETLESGLI